MIGFPIGVLVSNATEWFLHKYVLHGLGRSKKSYWSFHWHEHHKHSKKNGFHDRDYERSALGWNAQGKEAYGLITLAVGVAPLLSFAPYFCVGVWASSMAYYATHKKAHLDPSWARKHLPWHYDHHMGPDQDANWCVTYPLFDHLMGTRVPYYGTAREAEDNARIAARVKKTSATVATATAPRATTTAA